MIEGNNVVSIDGCHCLEKELVEHLKAVFQKVNKVDIEKMNELLSEHEMQMNMEGGTRLWYLIKLATTQSKEESK